MLFNVASFHLDFAGVVTKPDLVDPGAEHELIEVISNARYQLQRGYTLVKCRGQAAINSGISLREALAEERNYFASHPHLRSTLFSYFNSFLLHVSYQQTNRNASIVGTQ